MKKMSPIPTFPIALEIRAGRIPVRWVLRDHLIQELRDVDGRLLTKGHTERVFWPQVKTTKWGDAKTTEIENPLELRARLFKACNTKWTEKAALDFLNSVGAWRLAPGGIREEWAKGTYANVAFGHCFALNVRVLPVDAADLRAEVEYWYRLERLRADPAKAEHKKVFRTPPPPDARPSDSFAFATEAHFSNTLRVSLQWSGKDPRAVVEPIEGHELLQAAAWADVLGGVGSYVCARCTTRFAWPRKRKHCTDECAHADASRDYKRRKKAKALEAATRGT